MVEKFINLKPDAQESIFDYVLAVAAAFKEKPIAAPETSVSNLEKLTVDERVELFRMELEREERAGEKLQALPKIKAKSIFGFIKKFSILQSPRFLN